MRMPPINRTFGLGFLTLILASVPPASGQQNPPQGTTVQTPAPTSTPVKKVRRKRRPISTQSPRTSQPPQTAAQEELQRQKDQQLLKQQEADSRRAQQQEDADAQKLAKQRQAEASEPRIQDAPGPAQTGVVPGVPPQTQQTNQGPARIQDAPGPAQTLPAPQPAP
jgi:hypothetical protein